jgi:predicted nucleic acid-binding protein
VIVVDSSAAVEALRGWVRRGLVSVQQGRAAVHQWPLLGLTRFAMHPLLGRVWALQENVTACDAAYLAPAEELGCPLLTADARPERARGPRCEVRVLAG